MSRNLFECAVESVIADPIVCGSGQCKFPDLCGGFNAPESFRAAHVRLYFPLSLFPAIPIISHT